MEFYPIEMRTNYMKSEYAIAESATPVFSWGAHSSEDSAHQVSFRIVVSSGGECLWDSGIIESKEQTITYCGKNLKSGAS